MKTIARHLIVELYDCDAVAINDIGTVAEHLRQAAEICGATVVGEAFHQFEPEGVSGTLVIAESHLSIHTWPSRGYVAADIFTCGGLDPRPGFRHLKAAFGAASARVQEIVRGLPDELANPQDRALMPDDVQIVTETAQLD